MKARQDVTLETLTSSRPDDCKIPRAGYATWSCRCICDILVWQENIGLTRYRCCQVAQYGGTHSAALRSALLPFPASSLPQTVRKVLARLKYPVPLYKARSGFSILTEECLTFRTTSRENLSPADTSHFPRPWVGHVRRTAPPDGRHGDEDIQPWKTV